MRENDLYRHLFEVIEKYKVENTTYYYEPLPINIPKPTNNAKDISDDTALKVIEFFKVNVIPFATKLKKIANELTTGYDFNLDTIYNEIETISETISSTGDNITSTLPKNTKHNIKDIFRLVVWPWVQNSYFVRSGLLKPSGFPGDYMIAEAMYDGNAKSFGLGYIYDTIFLNTQLCRGLRNRKDMMKQIICNYLNNNQFGNIDILNVGCGSSRELREIDMPSSGGRITIGLMDFDQNAIDYSTKHIDSKQLQIKLIPFNIDVREIARQKNTDAFPVEKYDFIYSIGLFDYLSDKIIINLLNKLLTALKNSGLLIVSHKDYKLYDPAIADWFCDWKYFHRTQADFENLISNLDAHPRAVSFSREKDGYIFFAKITK